MDRALDDIITERQSSKQRGAPNRRRNDNGRSSYRKVLRPHSSFSLISSTSFTKPRFESNIERRRCTDWAGHIINDTEEKNRMDNDWLHDKYDDEDDYGSQPIGRFSRDRQPRDRLPEADLFDKSVKIRVENLHYDLTEEDLRDLFTRIAPVTDLKLSYDRAGRSLGTAYVTYRTERSARQAITEFDGANANGQPIRLSIVPSGPAAKRNPFDSVVRPSRSLADRIDNPRNGGGRDRSRSPGRERRNSARRTQRDDIDRYVPRERSRSPRRGRGGRGNRGDRRGGRGGRNDAEGRSTVQGRPRYTQEELDKDMDNYWGHVQVDGSTEAAGASTAASGQPEGDVDMVE
ncbi:MAG: hypothetical protein GOMPHAMPRED_002297 [Gomphillus americanus]|uniref:RRM domain-containing protein n=1 Tax=Gomphillus americanus TaxID=1940652 RepID=A0A8H3IPR3_9LECA|nr:MAG: hypothetical protein GOMPHAMPRED_002297 [Gomphillus americanus]